MISYDDVCVYVVYMLIVMFVAVWMCLGYILCGVSCMLVAFLLRLSGS